MAGNCLLLCVHCQAPPHIHSQPSNNATPMCLVCHYRKHGPLAMLQDGFLPLLPSNLTERERRIAIEGFVQGMAAIFALQECFSEDDNLDPLMILAVDAHWQDDLENYIVEKRRHRILLDPADVLQGRAKHHF